jgi:hypothetical protein
MRIAAVISLIASIVGCDRAAPTSKSSPQTAPASLTISTSDYDVSLPPGWKSIPTTERGLSIYESPDGNARLNVSVLRDNASLVAQDRREALDKICAISRKAEKSEGPNLQLTDIETDTAAAVLASKWSGVDVRAGLRTATFVQLSNGKLYIVLIECLDSSDAAAKQLSDQVFGSFAPR